MPGIHLFKAVPQSPLWYEIRNTKGNITASFAGNCMGINGEDINVRSIKDPVKRGQKQVQKAFQQIKEPASNTFRGNWFTRRGNFYEPLCFKVFEADLGIPVTETNMWQSTDHEWLYATPDGIIDKTTGLEVKNPYSHMHKAPPPHYMAQIQIQLHCSNRTRQYFMSQCLKENTARIWLVEYSSAFWNWMLPQLQHVHDMAMLEDGELDMSVFDFNPPVVPYTLVSEISSITDLIGEYEQFPEPFPFGGPSKRKDPEISVGPSVSRFSGNKRPTVKREGPDFPTEINF